MYIHPATKLPHSFREKSYALRFDRQGQRINFGLLLDSRASVHVHTSIREFFHSNRQSACVIGPLPVYIKSRSLHSRSCSSREALKIARVHDIREEESKRSLFRLHASVSARRVWSTASFVTSFPQLESGLLLRLFNRVYYRMVYLFKTKVTVACLFYCGGGMGTQKENRSELSYNTEWRAWVKVSC